MKYAIFICFGSLWTTVLSGNFTFTYPMAMRCKEHLCQHGYKYDTFYKADGSEKRNPISAEFEMHLAILGASNGHILLSSVPVPDANDPVYEIVVGGGANKFTELRRNLRRNAKASVKTVNILSPIEFRAFYIRISADGHIEFGKEGDSLPLLEYFDIDPLIIRYFSFAAWNGVEAKFLYDCPAPGDMNDTSPNSQEVEPVLSQSDVLRKTLLMERTVNMAPEPDMTIGLGVRVTSVSYDAFTGKLVTGLAVLASWTDNRMAWNPAKFNGISRLTFRQGQIWRPLFYTYNSDNIGIVDTTSPEMIIMVNSGEAAFHFQTKITTWCFETSVTLNTWPHDEYNCAILIGAWEPHEKFTLEELDASDNKMKSFIDVDAVVKNQWDMVIKMGIITNPLWNKLFMVQNNQTHQSDRLIVHINLKRKATAHNVVFYTPLLVLVTFILLSFVTDRLQISRVWFYVGANSVICAGLCYIDYLVPCHTVPSILILYTTVLMGILLALLLNIVLMTSAAEKFCKTMCMQSLLTGKWFRRTFFLAEMKTCRNYESINEGFDTQDDDEDSGFATAPRNGSLEEMESEPSTYGEIQDLAEAVDKLLLVTYAMVFAIMMALHF